MRLAESYADADAHSVVRIRPPRRPIAAGPRVHRRACRARRTGRDSDADRSPAPAGPDAGAPVFTQPPAQLGSRSLSFSGLKGITVVTVPLADGRRIPVLKISADAITIDGFSLTVRKETGPKLATTADQMALSGNVQVYLDSVTATGSDGKSITLGAATPPPADGLPPQLLRVTLGLVGVTADSIHFTAPHQHLSE
ncbi:hypothetical protein ACRAWB_08345 [Leifsonia poae]|uniref:hypothetical protein n=1 Tax=Leifsonia poae TaxID=110933 RepID=UPI003D69AF5A